MYNKVPPQQVINSKKSEPEVTDYDEYLVDWLASKEERRKNITKVSKTRQKKRNNRYAKEERLYGK
ncbi:hypothetical protein OAV41_01705 [Planctomycetota bacterium]|nr:hypothetical protein [Planctomycetota bacterium]